MPIDTRTVVDSKDDLTSVGYPYPGLIVNIKGTNQLYVCINANGVTTTEDDWKLVIDADTINNTVNNAITWIELTD
jgi:hypothetical protein